MPIRYPTLLTAIVTAFLIAACGGSGPTTAVETVDSDSTAQTGGDGTASGLPLWRYVNSGWVSPLNEQAVNAFSRELRAAVITSAEEMEEFNRNVVGKRTNGTGATLNRPKFPGSVVLVAYLMWHPVQGDPLSVVGLEVDGGRAVVELELDEDSQGREFPYMFAPMTMVTVERSVFPDRGPVEFEFRLDGQAMLTLSDPLD